MISCDICEFKHGDSCSKLATNMFSNCDYYSSVIPFDLTLKTIMSDGAHSKFWVVLPDGREGIYKINKLTSKGTYTYENVSEILAKAIGDRVGVPVCSVQIYNNAILSIAETLEPLYSFLAYSEEFSHSYHMSNLQTFNVSSLLNPRNNKYCSEVLSMLLFDILIGNSDRHPGNFAITSQGFYPLYDNGSSLCAYVNEEDINSLFSDSMRWRALQYSKSKPVLRDEQKLTHYQLLNLLKLQFPEEVAKFAHALSSVDIIEVLETVSRYVSQKRYELLYEFLAERKAWFYE